MAATELGVNIARMLVSSWNSFPKIQQNPAKRIWRLKRISWEATLTLQKMTHFEFCLSMYDLKGYLTNI